MGRHHVERSCHAAVEADLQCIVIGVTVTHEGAELVHRRVDTRVRTRSKGCRSAVARQSVRTDNWYRWIQIPHPEQVKSTGPQQTEGDDAVQNFTLQGQTPLRLIGTAR